ncbi:MAG: TIGR02300 family protein [Methylocystis sp.]|nr:TIGR02300 family protein [Methylocystis sp.]MBI3275654.1 TIGR02300 family protein [Methylocystis sp.]
MTKPELGAKRQCQSCGVKFFDFNKDPVICPKCATVFHVAPLARAAVRAVEAENETEVEKDGAETVSLEEVEASEKKVETVDVDEDVEIEDAAEEDDTFLEAEEGEDDDVTGLIDGDINSDEET